MKKIKFLLFLLLITLIFSCMNANALSNSIAYLGIELPTLRNYTQLSAQYKIDGSASQSYHNTGNINSCTENENGIKIKLYYVSKFSTEKTISSKNSTASWGNESATLIARAYNPWIKNNTFSPCNSYHSGIWYHY